MKIVFKKYKKVQDKIRIRLCLTPFYLFDNIGAGFQDPGKFVSSQKVLPSHSLQSFTKLFGAKYHKGALLECSIDQQVYGLL